MNNQKKHSHGGGSVLGILLIIVGGLWLLDNINIIDFHFSNWWPLILIFLGFADLTNSRRINNFSAWFFIVLGGLFLLPTNNVIGWHEIWKYWPVLLILIGLSMIFKRRSYYSPGRTSEITGEDHIKGTVIFGDLEKGSDSQKFSGGSLSTIFGDTTLNLKDAQLSEEGATLDASVVFGDILIMIPQSWILEIRSSNVLGDLKNKSRNTRESTGKRLIINANIIFGDLVITN